MDRLETYALKNNIPIMQKDGILFLIDYIKNYKINTILEIGTAIGYSAINMALINENIQIITIERDKERYEEAMKNIARFGLEKQIKVILGDALEIGVTGKFDLIFIDAAKAQYIKFFEKYKVNLNEHGVIISDNLNFHGLTQKPEAITSKNLRALVTKINKYKDFLNNNAEFKTSFLDIGDGLAISKKVD